jgi:peptide/nickel transport system ATP-binding protein
MRTELNQHPSSASTNQTLHKNKPLLILDNLHVFYKTGKNYVRAVDGVSLEIFEGDSLGLVGESGCGKSTLGFSIIRLLKNNASIPKGGVYYRNSSNEYIKVSTLSEHQLNSIRGNNISMVFQAAQDALNPLQTIKNHLVDTLKAHNVPKNLHDQKIVQIFEELDIPLSRLYDYPFQFSGGMQQRISIALAIILEPNFVICDEPTTALDVLIQAKIISMLKRLKEQKNLSMIFISHDLGVIAEISNKVAVMYAGQIVELGDTESVFKNSRHPYTQGLIESVPNIMAESHSMTSIPGNPPDLKNPPLGCRFSPRCKYVKQICITNEPPFWGKEGSNQYSRCFLETEEYSKSKEVENNE